ncbi:MAG: flagellar basal body P-ring protein FlgI [Deltaproteobacteria bacterium]|nr:flagellar basal body P-ring protein FlgI [Deltaproteobacteria bacterium]
MTRLVALLLLSLLPTAALGARAKDIGEFYGVRDNQITGAGLVVGLRRTGDSPRNEAAVRALAGRLQGLGVSLQVDDISARNVALVMISSTLVPDLRSGSRIDVVVASTGDATSLEGGVLLMTPLMGPDGQIYAVAEGPVVVGGYSVEAAGSASRKNNPTTGRVVAGAIVEREVPSRMDFNAMEEVEFVLHTPDFTTAMNLAESVNEEFGAEVASCRSSSTVALVLPQEFRGKFAYFAARIEATEVEIDAPARVVISERTGTVVMGADVTISAVAVAHGGLTIEVKRVDQTLQPAPLSNGTTAGQSNTTVQASEGEGQLQLLEGVSIGDLVTALNAMGVKPRDLMIILQAIQASGALHAEIVTI